MIRSYRDTLTEAFQKLYDSSADSWSNELPMRLLTEKLCQYTERRSRILDIGAGRGIDTKTLLEAGMRVTAVDLVRTEEWTALQEIWGSDLEYVNTDFQLYKGSPFDAVLDNGCAHHQRPLEVDKYISKVASLLNDEGVYAVSLFHSMPGRASEPLVSHDGRYSCTFTIEDAVDLLRRNSLHVRDLKIVDRNMRGWKYIHIIARKG